MTLQSYKIFLIIIKFILLFFLIYFERKSLNTTFIKYRIQGFFSSEMNYKNFFNSSKRAFLSLGRLAFSTFNSPFLAIK